MLRGLLIVAVSLTLFQWAEAGVTVPQSFAQRYLGKVVNDGQCAAGVQQIFFDNYKTWSILKTTKFWLPGIKVWGNGAHIPIGTAIASFADDGCYHSNHAAIYIGQNADGIQVYDQWLGQVFHQRTLKKQCSSKKPRSNCADYFYVVEPASSCCKTRCGKKIPNFKRKYFDKNLDFKPRQDAASESWSEIFED